jgi:hypothetical protein
MSGTAGPAKAAKALGVLKPPAHPVKGSSEFSLPGHSEIGLCIADSP